MSSTKNPKLKKNYSELQDFPSLKTVWTAL